MQVSDLTKQKVANFLFTQIPETEIGVAVNAAVNEKIRFLGSEWAEITTRMTADRLGLTTTETKRQLISSGPTKSKTEQGMQSALLKRRIKDDLLEQGLEIAREARLNGQINSWKLRAKELGCNKLESENVANCLLELLGSQLEFGNMLNISSLIGTVANAAADKIKLSLNILRCPPQQDSETEGIMVTPKLRFETTTASGKLAIIDQEANFICVQKITKILNRWSIPTTSKVILVDIDAFVMDAPNREKAVDEFEKNFGPLVEKILPGAKIERVSTRLSIDDVKKIMVNPESVFTEKQVEVEVDGIFTRLQERRLPPNLKTREAARDLAKKKLALEFVMGKELSKDSGAVFVQRARTTSAADVFLNGAKKVNNKPSFLFFWNERVVEE